VAIDRCINGELIDPPRRPISMVAWQGLVAVVLTCLASSGCNSTTFEQCGSGPCPKVPHHWTGHEVARDLESIPFPPALNNRDHLYHTACRITQHGTHANCVGRRKLGPNPGQRVGAEMLLRENGSLDLLCWPNPSQLCDPIQVREQRENPITE
jgi:hypothetical protein